MATENIIIKYSIDGGDISKAQNQISLLTKEEIELKKAAENAGKSIDRQADDIVKGNGKVKKTVEGLEGEYKVLQEAANKAYDQNAINSYNKALSNNRKELKKVSSEYKKTESSADKFTGSLQGVGRAFGAAIAVEKLVEYTLDFKNLEKEINSNRRTIERYGDISGDVLDNTVGKVRALSDTFGVSTDEIIRTANSFEEQGGISYVQALEKIEQGLLKGANAGGEFLTNIREYTKLLIDAGASTDDVVKIISTAEFEGVFNDKLVDSIFNFSNELKDTDKALKVLTKTFGRDFAQRAVSDFRSGSITALDVLKRIGEEAKRTNKNTQDLAGVTTSLGTGVTEDIGGILEVYRLYNQALDTNINQLDKLGQTQKKQLAASNRLNSELVKLTKNFEGFSTGIDTFLQTSGAAILEFLNDAIDGFSKVGKTTADSYRILAQVPPQISRAETLEALAEELNLRSTEIELEKQKQDNLKLTASLAIQSTKRIQDNTDILNQSFGILDKFPSRILQQAKSREQLNEVIANANEQIDKQTLLLSFNQKRFGENNQQTKVANRIIKAYSDLVAEATRRVNELNETNPTLGLLERLRAKISELEKERDKSNSEKRIKELSSEIDVINKRIRSLTTVNEKEKEGIGVLGEKRKELSELTKSLNSASIEEIAGINKRIEKLKEEIKELENLGKKRANNLQELINSFNAERNLFANKINELSAIQLKALSSFNGSYEELENERIEISEKANLAILKNDIQLLEQQLIFAQNNGAKTLSIETELVNKKKELADTEVQIQLDKLARIEEQERISSEKRKEILNGFKEAFINITNLQFEFAATKSEQRISALEKERDNDLRLAGDNATAKSVIEQRYTRDINREQSKRAKIERDAKIFSALTSGFQGAAQAAARAELFPFNFVLAGLILTQTALQVRNIRQAALPAFKDGVEDFRGKGTTTSDSNPVRISDHERIVSAKINKNLKGIPNKKLPEMAEIYQKYLNGDFKQPLEFDYNVPKTKSIETNNYYRDNKELIQAIKDIPINEYHHNERGYSEYTRTKQGRIKMLNKDNSTYS